MKKYSKITLFFVIIFIILFVYLGYYFLKKEFHLDATPPPPVAEYQKTEEELQDEKQIQYRMEYRNKGTMLQIIHMNKGDALFKFEHDGNSEFDVVLEDANGFFIDTLVNDQGKYEGSKMINVDEEGAYLLDIIADGKWVISFK